MCDRSPTILMLRYTRTAAITMQMFFTTGLIAKTPIVFFVTNKMNKRYNSKTQCRLNITWLRINNSVELLVAIYTYYDQCRNNSDQPGKQSLSKGLIRMRKYPSITICPPSVPVIVELCPVAINAAAKKC